MSASNRIGKVKKFLKSSLNKNFWAFLFFLVLSAGFWLFLALEDIYEIEVSVPVKLKNVPENVVITTSPPQSVKLRLRDNGSLLMRYKYANSLGTITLDFNDYDTRSGHVVVPTAQVARNIIARLQNSTTLVSLSPDTLEYFYNFGLNKSVPVRVAGDITADSLFCVTATQLSPSHVKVYASKDILDTLTAVYTNPINLTGLSEQRTVSTSLRTLRGAKIVPKSVNATFFVDQITEKTLPIHIDHINFPAGKTLKTFPSVVNVTFQVGLKQYRSITADKFAIVVSYDDIADNTDNRLRLTLKSIPPGISNLRIVPEYVEFVIEDHDVD